MSVFIGGSAYNMARDVAEGYIMVSERTFKQYKPQEFMDFTFEVDRLLREVRAAQVAVTDTEGAQKRQRKMHRLQQALTLAHSVRARKH